MLSSVTEKADGDNDRSKAEQDEYYQQACKSIAEHIESSKNLLSLKQILKVIRHVASEYNLATIPRNEHIILYLHDNHYRHLLMVKPAKTASGV
ncbi:MAG: hypothetical protein ACJ70S_08370, partial [Nitrososphaera sp.]